MPLGSDAADHEIVNGSVTGAESAGPSGRGAVGAACAGAIATTSAKPQRTNSTGSRNFSAPSSSRAQGGLRGRWAIRGRSLNGLSASRRQTPFSRSVNRMRLGRGLRATRGNSLERVRAASAGQPTGLGPWGCSADPATRSGTSGLSRPRLPRCLSVRYCWDERTLAQPSALYGFLARGSLAATVVGLGVRSVAISLRPNLHLRVAVAHGGC
jgi:hypothetical protein